MQGVIYGNHSDELAAHPSLATRFDIDEWWGTVVNRFVAQAVIGMPLTIYGSGNQLRGYITLKDAMQCITRLIAKPPEPGQYDVVNQVTDVMSVKQIAQTVARIGAEFGLDTEVQRIENPRVEAEEHPYEVISRQTQRQLRIRIRIGLRRRSPRPVPRTNATGSRGSHQGAGSQALPQNQVVRGRG